VERRVELYKQVGATNDLTVSANSLKRRWQKRQRLNNAEKKLLLPVKKDSSDEEDVDDSVTDLDDVSESEAGNSDNAAEDSSNDMDNVTPLLTIRDDILSNNGAEGQTAGAVYSTVERPASSPSHNPMPDCTVKTDAKKETVAKDGHNFCQQTDKALEQQVPTPYISVDRLPEMQVSIFKSSLTL